MRKRICSLLLICALLSGIVLAAAPARAASSMTASQEVLDLIKLYEGFSKYPYWDVSQYSVGYGTRCPSDKLEEYMENGITEEEAEELLAYYISSFSSSINSYANKYGLTFTQNQFDAILSLSYNCGTAWMSDSSGVLNTAIRTGATGNELIYAFSLWSKSATYGLVRRRLAEANLYLNGTYSTSKPSNYRYVFLDGNGGTVNYSIHGFDASNPTSILATVSSSITVTSGETTKTLYFAGWYTAASGGTQVTVLDSSISDGTTLYAHWTESGSDSSSSEVTTPAEPESTPADVDVTVTGNDVNVRSGPGTSYSVLYRVSNGVSIHISATATASNGLQWGKFTYNGTTGWICLDYTSYGKTSSSDSSGDTGSTSEESESGVAGVVISSGVLNIRSGPGTGYTVVGTYSSGETVTILEQSGGWGRTSLGWVSMTYIRLGTDSSAETTTPETTAATEATEPEATEPEETEPYESWVGTVLISGTLNVRSGPGSKYTILDCLSNGTVVTILDESGNWGKIDGGWISLLYVTAGVVEVEDEEPETNESEPESGETATVEGSWTGTAASTVCVRSIPGITGSIVGWVQPGGSVTVTQKVISGGKLWGKTDGGWICLSFLELSGESETPTVETLVSAEGETLETPEAYTVGSYSLRVRSAAGLGNAIVDYIAYGERVTVYELRTVGSVVWGRIDTGWVNMDYLEAA
ncbi:MAG: SH3 domain-containing protein [Firmicutes bacterium]|nr:SH3 domain-containing protein [Bacillota bacterium]